MALDIYQAVTDRILEMLDKGTVLGRHPIRKGTGDGFPRNLNSGRNYRGVNVFLLAITSWIKGYKSSYWMTFKQARKLGGQVRRGEKASLVVFWKRHDTTDKETGKEKTIPVIRHYNVFNAEQCDGIKVPDSMVPDDDAKPFEPIAAAERIMAGHANPPSIQHGGGRAFYRPSEDMVRIADPDRFESGEDYYATLFHELAHSTGHKSRLDRGLDDKLNVFGSTDYSKEELIAEMGAAYLAALPASAHRRLSNRRPTSKEGARSSGGWCRAACRRSHSGREMAGAIDG